MTGRRPIALLGICAALGGCFGAVAKPPPLVHEYRLAYVAPAIRGDPLPVTLRVGPVRVASTYAGAAIVYREDEHRVGAYNYHRWATDPGAMVGELLTRDLVDSGRYRAVEYGPSLVPADYVLMIEVEEMGERLRGGCEAHVQLRVLLTRARPRDREGVVFQRVYDAGEPCAAGDAGQVVAALSAALARISEEVQSDLAAAIRSTDRL